MSNLPPVKSWPGEFPLIEPNPETPIRADAAGVGDEFVLKLVAKGTAGAKNQFLARDGTWINFASTELNAWGSIIGNLEDQADLWAELQARPLKTEISAVGYSGQYNDLLNKPVLGDLAFINTTGQTSYFLRADGTWQIPVDVYATWGNISGNINAQTDLKQALDLKAPLTSPVFTGTPRAPTPPAGDNTDRIATTAWFFGQAFNGSPVMDGAASSGDSLQWARGNHRHPTDTTRAPLDSPNFVGIPVAPTPPVTDDSDRVATTAYVKDSIDAAGLTPPPSDGQIYGFQNGAWVVLDFGTRWDRT